jgi:DNA-binding GntR family transcriptional regulator
MNATDRAYKSIKEAIITGEYPQLMHLVEAKLSDQWGISRHIVRVVLERLNSESLVKIEPNRGAVVCSLSLEETLDLINTRGIIEGATTRLAAEKIIPDQIKKLEECHDKMIKFMLSDDVESYLEWNRFFHAVILDAVGSRIIPELINMIRSRLARLPSKTMLIPGRMAESTNDHEAILTSLRAKDGDAAESHAKKHMENLKTLVEIYWRLLGS